MTSDPSIQKLWTLWLSMADHLAFWNPTVAGITLIAVAFALGHLARKLF